MYELDMKEMGSGSFSDPFRHAAGFRQAMDEPKMRFWNSLPSFLQNTIFHGEQDTSIASLRATGNLADRLAFAEECKSRGNAKLKSAEDEADFEAAISCYEKAAGILRYVECTRPDWKNPDGSYKGLEDAFIKLNVSALDGSEDSQETQKAAVMVTSCYLNIALAAHRLQRWDLSEQASDAVQALDPSSVKALYRRAQARLGRHRQTGIEDNREKAVADLRAAAKLAPQDREVRRILEEVLQEMRAQRQGERASFAGLFDRGEVVTDAHSRQDGGPEQLLEADAKPIKNASPSKPASAEKVWDLRDPRVQALLDIRPGPEFVV